MPGVAMAHNPVSTNIIVASVCDSWLLVSLVACLCFHRFLDFLGEQFCLIDMLRKLKMRDPDIQAKVTRRRSRHFQRDDTKNKIRLIL